MNPEEYFDDFDPSWNIVFKASWSSYEEDGWIFIFEKEKSSAL